MINNIKEGGAKELSTTTPINDTNVLLNRYLRKHDARNKTKVISNQDYNFLKRKSVLYVIDMQNDFMDIPLEGLTGLHVPEHITGKPNTHIGAFAVNNGTSFISDLINHLNQNVNKYEKVVFSRDFHDKDHCSFAPGGTFPPHCTIGSFGSGFHADIKEWLNKNYNEGKWKNKIDIVFKGMHPNYDSFTAVSNNAHQEKRQIGDKCCGSSTSKKDPSLCSKNAILGAMVLKSDTDFDPIADNLFKDTDGTWESIEKYYEPYIVPEGNHYYVCGLAGDFCVRDTAFGLKDMGKNVDVLHDFTRNAFVPLSVPLKTTTYNPNERYGSLPLEATHLNGTSLSNAVYNTDSEKGFQHYVFQFEPPSTYKILNIEDLNKLKNLNNFTLEVDPSKLETSPGEYIKFNDGSSYFHFITDHRQIIDDYRNAGIKLITRSNPMSFYKDTSTNKQLSSSKHVNPMGPFFRKRPGGKRRTRKSKKRSRRVKSRKNASNET
jgi:nicotinamidase-related amidase